MKRFHVHLHVDELAKSIDFYERLFAAAPSRVEGDYAKWMLDDPPLNFAISTRGARPGIDHLGIQTDDPVELDALKARAAAADLVLLDEGATTCCYARSEKHWVTDPQGIAWEHFQTLGSIPVFKEAPTHAHPASACCTPTAARGAGHDARDGTTSSARPDHAATGCPPQPRGKPIGIAVNASPSSCC